jgi:cell division septation protein DedD
MPGVKKPEASQKIQKAPLPGAVEIKPMATPPRTPAASIPRGAPPDSEDFREAKRAQSEAGKLALMTKPASINLAKATPDESANRANSTPGQVWVVQVASYAREPDARAFAAKLKDKGYTLNIVPGEVAGQARYRVEIGPLPTRDDAQALQNELAAVHKIEQTLLLMRSVNPTSGVLAR